MKKQRAGGVAFEAATAMKAGQIKILGCVDEFDQAKAGGEADD